MPNLLSDWTSARVQRVLAVPASGAASPPRRTPTHTERVLALLSDGHAHTHHELYALGVIAHSRVADLRRRGYTIETWRYGSMHMYQLVAGPVPDAQ